jgi:hypothetical protein
MRKIILALLGLLISILSITTVSAQQGKPVADIDFVQIKNGKKAEAMFFYENNWRLFRQAALDRGYIKSYKLLTTSADSLANFHIILITEFKDSVQYKAREENFRIILKEIPPEGTKLLNDLKPGDFRTIVFSKRSITEYENQAIKK